MKKDTLLFISITTVSVVFVAGIMTDNISQAVRPRPQIPVIDIAQLLM